ncbi:hypothetical protein DPB93_25855 [Salmonella enterica subsp. salamae]|nr:PerC family transcriptional regulator [Salmonella enterica subsp. salamae]ECI4078936.1 hypothetical protein [Salmonella enterica subsp. salamae]
MVRGTLSMVRDEKAESLEKVCLYHLAALRWFVVLNECTKQSEKIMGVLASKSMSGKSKEKKGEMTFNTRTFL